MGKEFVVNSLEDMCALMCDNNTEGLEVIDTLKKGIKNEDFDKYFERLKDYAVWNKKVIDAECKRNEPFYEEVRRRLRTLQCAQAESED